MKIKEGFILREVADSFVAVAVGDTASSFNGLINLNETGAFIWKQLENDTTQKDVVDALLKEYDIDEKTASDAVDAFLQQLRNVNLICE